MLCSVQLPAARPTCPRLPTSHFCRWVSPLANVTTSSTTFLCSPLHFPARNSHPLLRVLPPLSLARVCCRDKQRGYQLYQSDPSGNYGGWKATAIGANHQVGGRGGAGSCSRHSRAIARG